MRRRRPWGVFALTLVLLGLASLALRERVAPERVAATPPRADAREPAPPAELAAGPARGEAGAPRERLTANDSAAAEGPPDDALAPVALTDFIGTLVDPEGDEVEVALVRAELRAADGAARLFEGERVSRVEYPGLEVGRYELRLSVEGYTHEAESIVIEAEHEPASPGRCVREQRITLWPPEWVPIVIRLRDGRPFSALARDRGLEPKRLFVNAFQVYASVELVAPGLNLPLVDESLATFRPPPTYQQVELAPGIAGSLELHAPRPLWVGLWVYGEFYRGRILREGDRRLVFELDAADLDERLALVSLRVLDRESGAAVQGALVTLKADTSAHRRGDLSGVPTDGEGRVELRRVLPGDYELTIVREGHQVQRRLRVWSRTNDLGDFPMGAGAGLTVRVVDEAGRPVRACIEIGPFELGNLADELYPPNLHRWTDAEGVYLAPIPDRPAMIRARPRELNGRAREYLQVGTRNALIDPERLPLELVLVAVERVHVRFEPAAPWDPEHRLELLDELGLIVATSSPHNAEDLGAQVVPGSYSVRRVDGLGHQLGAFRVVIDAATRVVQAP